MTHSSFASEFGPGPHLKREFEKTCKCVVEYRNVGEAGLIVKKLKLGTPVDIVMGMDLLSIHQMGESLKWKETNITRTWHPYVRPKGNLLPYDWSPMTFIYRKGEISPPQTWSQLFSSKGYKVGLQDPRSSSPGLQFLWWVYSIDTKESLFDKLKGFHQIDYRISPSWSMAYGLFKAKHTQMVFSYLSSLFYHWNEEKDFRYQAVSFPSGHPLQVEYMGILESSSQDKLAKEFCEWVLSVRGQEILMKYNYMFPAVGNQPIENMPQLKILSPKKWKDFVTHLDDHLRTWQKSLR